MMLKPGQFARLRRIVGAEHWVKQKNTYYDYPQNPLQNQQMGMRIRHRGHTNEFTCKIGQPDGSRMEWTQPLSTDSSFLAFSDPEIVAFLKNAGYSGLPEKTGSCTTWRYEIVYPEGTLCLDKNRYCGITDYELEFECFPEVPLEKAWLTLTAILQKASLSYTANPLTKLARCAQAAQPRKKAR